MDYEIFFTRAQSFVEEMEQLLDKFKNIVLSLDAFAEHVTARVMCLFKEKRIVVKKISYGLVND